MNSDTLTAAETLASFPKAEPTLATETAAAPERSFHHEKHVRRHPIAVDTAVETSAALTSKISPGNKN